MQGREQDLLERNIFHELNKMLLVISKDFDFSEFQIKPQKNTNSEKESLERCSYYLNFPLKVRESMASNLGISEKTLHRIYEQPLKLLDNLDVIVKYCSYFNSSLNIFFNKITSENGLPEKVSTDSQFLKSILEFEKDLGIEDRRTLIRTILLLKSSKVPLSKFFHINSNLLQKKFFGDANYQRMIQFIKSL